MTLTAGGHCFWWNTVLTITMAWSITTVVLDYKITTVLTNINLKFGKKRQWNSLVKLSIHNDDGWIDGSTMDHSLSMFTKFSEILSFFTPWYAHIRIWEHTKQIIPDVIQRQPVKGFYLKRRSIICYLNPWKMAMNELMKKLDAWKFSQHNRYFSGLLTTQFRTILCKTH